MFRFVGVIYIAILTVLLYRVLQESSMSVDDEKM